MGIRCTEIKSQANGKKRVTMGTKHIKSDAVFGRAIKGTSGLQWNREAQFPN